MPPTTPPWCPCTVGGLANVGVPWFQWPTVNPTGDKVYSIPWGDNYNSGYIVVHTAPEVGFGFSVRLPDEAGPPGVERDLVGGIAFDALGRLYYTTRSPSDFWNQNGSSGPPYDTYGWEDYIWRRSTDGTWTSIWSSSHEGDPNATGPPRSRFGLNGIYYSVFHDDVILARTDLTQSNPNFPPGTTTDYIVGASGTIYYNKSTLLTGSPHQGYSHYMPHPDDGSIWESTFHGSTGVRGLRRFHAGAVTQFTFQPMTVGSLNQSLSVSVPDPENFGHVFHTGRLPGDTVDKIWRISENGTPVASSTLCFQARSAHSTWTPDMGRVLSTFGSGSGSGTLVEWAVNCSTFIPEPCAPPYTPSGGGSGVWVGHLFGGGGGGGGGPTPSEGVIRASLWPNSSTHTNGSTTFVWFNATPAAEFSIYPGPEEVSEDAPNVGLCGDFQSRLLYVRGSEIQSAGISAFNFTATGGTVAGNVELFLTIYDPTDMSIIHEVSTVDDGATPLSVGVALAAPLDISAYDHVMVSLRLRNNSGVTIGTLSSSTPLEVHWLA